MINKEVLPEAFYDSLSIAFRLGDTLIDFKQEEIHLFSYFSSILFLYKRNLFTNWKYNYIIDTKGFPFSVELDEAIRRHKLNSILKAGDVYLEITPKGIREYYKFKDMPYMSKREEYIEASCSTNIVLPYSKTIRALLNDFEIAKRKKINSRQVDIDMAYQKFAELSKAVGVPVDDLIIPAVTWINYISGLFPQETK
jgi:macrodomain Ter protein organizer (MatP/YcbG family)